MLKVKTKTGFECEIDETVMNKYSFIKLLGKFEKDPTKIVDVLAVLLGDNEEALIDHLGGDPEIEAISNEIGDIFDCIAEDSKAKKS